MLDQLHQRANIGMVALGSGTDVLGSGPGCDRHQKLVFSALRLDTDQPANAISAVAKYIKLLEIHMNPLNMSAIITANMCSGSPIARPQLSGMYLVKESDNQVGSIGGRILHPQWIDRDLPKLWKTTCTCLHEGLCKGFPDETMSSIRPIWLVDVTRQCLVQAPEKCSYVALSYVWGDRATLKAVRNNVSRLQETGSLSMNHLATPIAKTIRDAMGVVGLLGERYLWVDTLCIVHDEELQKHTEMAKMAAIYGNASVTILAVQGEHANYGLRGFGDISEPRNLHQSVHSLGDEVRVVQNPIEPNYLELGIDNPVWESRGWTYQEHLFSRRRLIFDGDSVRWECAAAIWREHVELPSHLKPHYNQVIDCQSLFRPSIPGLTGLQSILQVYNKRNFTYPEDALNGFAGISFAISPALAGRFVSGLPTAFFDIALLWQPHDKIFRRVARDPKRKHCLPSWSWAGWSGLVNLDSRSASDFVRNSPGRVKFSHERRIMRILSWKYHDTPESPGTSIEASILSSKETWMEGRIEAVQGWTEHFISESPEARYEPPDPRSPTMYFYKHAAHPSYEFWYPIPLLLQEDAIPGILAPYISCRTRRAWMFPGEELPKKNGYCPVLSLRDKEKIWAGIIQPHDGLDESGEALQDPSEAVELVEIAMGFCRDSTSPWPGIEEIRHLERPKEGQWYEYYWVMWVGWTEGIAYRKGLGRVHRRIWEEHRGELFDLMLG